MNFKALSSSTQHLERRNLQINCKTMLIKCNSQQDLMTLLHG